MLKGLSPGVFMVHGVLEGRAGVFGEMPEGRMGRLLTWEDFRVRV
jgi:hypothetical protein